MLLLDLTISCRPSDVQVLRPSEKNRMRAVLHSFGDQRWLQLSLTRSSDTEWRYGGPPVEILDRTRENIWITLFTEFNTGVAHTCQYKADLDTWRAACAENQVMEVEKDLDGEVPPPARPTFKLWMSLSEDRAPIPPSPPDAELIDGYGHYFNRRYIRDNSPAYLENAIESWETVLELVEGANTQVVEVCQALGMALHERFRRDADREDLERAIGHLERAEACLEELRADSSLRSGVLSDLAICYKTLSVLTDNVQDLDRCVDAQREATSSTPPGDRLRLSARLCALAVSLYDRYAHFSGEPSDIEASIDAARKSVDLTPADATDLADRLFILGKSLESSFRVSGNLEIGKEAISTIQMASILMPTTHEDFIPILDRLGLLYRAQFGRSGNLIDIRLSIATLSKAVKRTPSENTLLPQLLTDLGVSLQTSFYRTEDIGEIEDSISILENAVALTPSSSPALPLRLTQLGEAYRFKHTVTRDLNDLQQAISTLRRAVDTTPEGSGPFITRLTALARVLETRSHETGESIDTQGVLSAMEREANSRADGDPQLPIILRELSLMLVSRYRRANDAEDLKKAVPVLEKAISLVPEGYWDLPGWYNELGGAYETCYDADLAPAHLDRAIEAKRKAVELTSDTLSSKPLCLNSLALSLRRYFKVTSDITHLDETIEHQRHAIGLVKEDHAGLQLWYARLGETYKMRFGASGLTHDIEKAIEAQRRSADLVKEGSSDYPMRRNTLGEYYLAAYERSKSPEMLQEAIVLWRSAALSPTGSARLRIQASQYWAKWVRSVDGDSRLEAFERSIELLSAFVAMEQSRGRRHENIEEISGIALSACAAALDSGKVEKGLEWLERGRCLAWNQLNSLRTPLDELRLIDESLANRFAAVSAALESSSPDAGIASVKVSRSGDDVKQGVDHVDLTLEWKRLVSSIREKPGFEDFLATTSSASLLDGLPSSGTVVVINMHWERCDAIALQSGWKTPIHIPLPLVTIAKAKRMAVNIREQLGMRGAVVRGYDVGAGVSAGEDWVRDEEAIGGETEQIPSGDDYSGTDEAVVDRGLRRVRGEKPGLLQTLRELWTTLVGPILQAIGYTRTADSPKRRIWWCATGDLVFLPLHAAGEYVPGGQTTSDFAVSSYIPNISALTSRTKRTHISSNGVFLASQPKTPGQMPLPGTTKEIEAILPVFQELELPTRWLDGEQVTSTTALENMGQMSCIHLACHAIQDKSEPLSSGFFLQDGRLTLSTIMKHNLATADLAFLSACQTSAGNEKLSEEAVHLAAGMMAAGYRGVVATMWSIQDQHAPTIAKTFYKEMARLTKASSGRGIDGSHAAEALHAAVGELRRNLGDSEGALLTWVPYVHFGL